jgi:excisionase family DNA binding protein
MPPKAQPAGTFPDRLAYRFPEAAAALGVSRAHLYNLAQRGELRTVKIGSSRRIPRSEVERLAGLRGDAS